MNNDRSTPNPVRTEAGGSEEPRSAVTVDLDFDDTITPSIAVVEAIATATDTDPLNLEPLAESIDPGALDAFLSSNGGSSVILQFEYDGQWVTVDSADRVTLSVGEGGYESG